MPHRMAMTWVNMGKRGAKKVPRSSTLAARLRARKVNTKRGKMTGARKAAFIRKMKAGRRAAKAARQTKATKARLRILKMRKRSPALSRAAVRRFARSGLAGRNMLSKKKSIARRRAKTNGARKMARRGKLRGKAKAAFLRKMARGRAAAARRGGSSRRRGRKKNWGSAAMQRSLSRSYPSAAASRGKRTKHQKRVAAGKKAWRTRLAKKAARSAAAKRSHRSGFRRTKRARGYAAITRKIRKLSGRIRGGRRSHGKRSGGRRSTPSTARLAVLRQQRRSIFPGVSADSRHYMKIHGLTKVNRGGRMSLKAELRLIPSLLGQGVAALGGFLSLGALGLVGGNWLIEQYPMLGDSPWKRVGTKGLVGVAGTTVLYVGARMLPATRRISGLLGIGGLIGTAANMISEAVVTIDGEEKTLANVLMQPIGSTLLPGLNLGPVDKRLGKYENPESFRGYESREQFQMSGNRSMMGKYMPRTQFEGPRASDAALKRDAALRKMEQLSGRDAGGSRDDGTM